MSSYLRWFGLCLVIGLVNISWSENDLAPLALHKPKIFLIIDDLGDNLHLGKRIVGLPAPVNLSFLPSTPFAQRLATMGHNAGHDVMLHIPMEAFSREDLLGADALRMHHNKRQLETIFQRNIQLIPHVRGFNNHMGSRLTLSKPHMNWLMAMAREQHLYFVDSRTNALSEAYNIARQWGVPAIGRDVFLDPVQEGISVRQQLFQALKVADDKGLVVIIGHPFPATITMLEQELPYISKHYQLSSLAEHLDYQIQTQ